MVSNFANPITKNAPALTPDARLSHLTAYQRRILALLARGMTDGDIATTLGKRHAGVCKQVYRIRMTLTPAYSTAPPMTRVELARFAIANGVTTLEPTLDEIRKGLAQPNHAG